MSLPDFFLGLLLCGAPRRRSGSIALHGRSGFARRRKARIVTGQAFDAHEDGLVFAQMLVERYDEIILVIVVGAIAGFEPSVEAPCDSNLPLTWGSRSPPQSRPILAFSATSRTVDQTSLNEIGPMRK